MGQKTVNVNWNGSALTIDSTPLDLEDGDWVEWKFHGLSQGEFGFISFDPKVAKFGPFHSLRSHGNDSFLGKGNKAEQKDFPYLALILNLKDKNPIASGSGTVHNRATKKDTAPDVTVTYDPDAQTLDVSPNPLCLNVGDTATWSFVNVPVNAFVCFEFEPAAAADGTPVEEMAGASGPFVAFNACRSEGGTVQASGMGFVATIPVDRWPKSFTYHLQLRCWEGNFLAGHDPIIDNLGPPAPG